MVSSFAPINSRIGVAKNHETTKKVTASPTTIGRIAPSTRLAPSRSPCPFRRATTAVTAVAIATSTT